MGGSQSPQACSAHRESLGKCVRIAHKKMAGFFTSSTCSCRSIFRRRMVVCLFKGARFMQCYLLCCLPCELLPILRSPAGSGCCCELKDSLLLSLEHHFFLQLPRGGDGCHTLLPVRECAGFNSLHKSSVPPCGTETASDTWDATAMAMLSPASSKAFPMECFTTFFQHH